MTGTVGGKSGCCACSFAPSQPEVVAVSVEQRPGGSGASASDPRWLAVRQRIRQLGATPDSLIEVLHAVQEQYGYLEPGALAAVGEALRVPPSTVMGVATFYSHFTLRPSAAHTCVVCDGTACYIDGAKAVLQRLRGSLGLEPGATSADGRISLSTASCLGTCSMAPVVVVDGEVIGDAGDAVLDEILEHLLHQSLRHDLEGRR